MASFKLTHTSISREWPQISLLVLLTLIFSCNAIGLIEFGGNTSFGAELKFSVLTTPDGSFSIPPIAKNGEFASLVISGLILAVLSPLLKPIPASVLVLLLTFSPLYMGINAPFNANVIPMQYSLLVLLMLFGMNILFNYFVETHRKQNLINIFGRFVPPEIVEQLNQNPELFNLDGELKKMTVFFCDLKNFSGVSEELDPKQLVSLLNEYFTIMTEILYKYGATIDKYIGDSIMAFWGAPVPQDDHARRAILASFEMHEAINRLSQEYINRGWPGPTMGVGINSGMMNVGNMGSKYRLAYTVVGDDVNLSSRLQDLTRQYKVPTIVGENTIQNITDLAFRELDTVTVKGKNHPTRIYQPLGLRSEISSKMTEILALHEKALEAYYALDYALALDSFKSLLIKSGQDPYYEFIISKINKNPLLLEK